MRSRKELSFKDPEEYTTQELIREVKELDRYIRWHCGRYVGFDYARMRFHWAKDLKALKEELDKRVSLANAKQLRLVEID